MASYLTRRPSRVLVEGKAGAIEGKTKIRIIEARRLFDSFNTVATAGAGILWAGGIRFGYLGRTLHLARATTGEFLGQG